MTKRKMKRMGFFNNLYSLCCNSRQMLFVVVASLISFWPYMAGYRLTFLEHTALRDAVDNNELNKFSAVCAFSLMVPLFMDWFTDLYGRKKQDDNNTFLLHHFEKAVLYLGLLSVPSLAFVSSSYEDLTLLWFCMTRFQIVAVLGTLTASFSRINSYAWPWWISLLSTSLLSFAVNLSLYGTLMQSGAIFIVDVTIKVILLILIIVSTIRWLLRPNFSKSFASLYLRVGSSAYVTIIIVLVAIGPKENLTSNKLLIYNATFIALELGILYYKMRRTKYERFNDIRGLIESRKQYLRYVAHEIRTPLNSACLGTKLLVDALASIEEKDEFDEELFETAKDVTKTLDIAVGILADLMTFNKIESGILQLTKSVVPIKPYVFEVIDTFAAEARAKGIHVEIGVADGALALIDSDVVIGDKFKLYEVLRNLISNALKYSSRNSTISVHVGFCPSKPPPRSTPNNTHFFTHSASSSKRGKKSTSIRGRFVDMLARSMRVQNTNPSVSRGRNTGSIRERFMARLSRSIRVQNNDEHEMDMQGELVVVVTDHGVGISKENQKLLFQEGMQFDPEKLQTGGGSGFGLFISKSIVQMHGGSMEILCEGEGKSCSFLYRIPMIRQLDVILLHAAEMAVAAAASVAASVANGQAPSQGSLHAPASKEPSSQGDKSGARGGGESDVSASAARRHGDSVDDPRSASLRSGASVASFASKRISRHKGAESLRLARADSLRQKRRNSAQNTSFHEDVGSHACSTSSPLLSRAPVTIPVDMLAISHLNKMGSTDSRPSYNSAQQFSPLLSEQKSSGRLSGLGVSSGSSLVPIRPMLSEAKDDENRAAESPRRPRSSRNTGIGRTLTAIPSRDVSELESASNSVFASGTLCKSPKNRVRSPPASVENSNGMHYHCLVVDDSGMSRKMLIKTLKAYGHTCDEAEDGQMAVRMVKEKGLTAHDAILMDFVMPVLDGPDATKAIRALGYTGPIIGCTGNTLDMDLLRFKQSGCDRVIGKPFQPELFHQFMIELTGGTSHPPSGALDHSLPHRSADMASSIAGSMAASMV